MLVPLRLLALTSTLLVATAAVAGAQDRPYRPRAESFRIKRPPYSYFKYRVPSMQSRMFPRIRLEQGAMQRRALERSLDRIDRVRGRQFALQDRVWRRQFELRTRAMERVHERMGRLQMDRFHLSRPFLFHRRLRTI